MASSAKKAKSSGRPFQSSWTSDFGMVSQNDKALCTICRDTVVARTFSVKRHFETSHQGKIPQAAADRCEFLRKSVQRYMDEISKSSAIMTSFTGESLSLATASYSVARIIADHGKPFTNGPYVKEICLAICDSLITNRSDRESILKKIREVPLSDSTIKSRIIEMAESVYEQQTSDMSETPFFSLACDESTDIKDVAQLAVIARYVVGDEVKEELLALTPLTNRTRGEDICSAVLQHLRDRGLDVNKLVSLTTDGAPAMTGKTKGFVSLLSAAVDHDVLRIHCIIHEEALCAKISDNELSNVMSVVTKVVNFIVTKALNHRQFRALLQEAESEYGDLVIYCAVRWLSRGKVLERFVTCLPEIKDFLEDKSISFPELYDPLWLCKLGFLTDICSHLNELNRRLQGKGQLPGTMCEQVRIFTSKLALFLSTLCQGSFKHFPTVTMLSAGSEDAQRAVLPELSQFVGNLKSAFEKRFEKLSDLRDLFRFLTAPTEVDRSHLSEIEWVDTDVDVEIIELKESEIWKGKFLQLQEKLENLEKEKAQLAATKQWKAMKALPKADDLVIKTWTQLPCTFNKLKRIAFAVITIFASSYSCEQLFSQMNLVHSKLRNRLSDQTTEACLRLKSSSYSPDITCLVSGKQQQKSH